MTAFCRAAVVFLILIGMVAPPRLVFACQQMGGKRQYTCCCHKQATPCRHSSCKHQAKASLDAGKEKACCEVSQEAKAEAQATPTGQFKLLYSPQPMPAPIAKEVLAQAIPDLSVVFSSRHPVWLSTSRTYLITLRLRI